MDSGMMGAHNTTNLRTRYYYQYFANDELYKEKPQPVVLTNILPDSINTYIREYTGQIVEEINGVKITKLKDVAEALAKDPEGGFITVRLLGEGRPIVLDKKEAAGAQKRILQKYNVEEPAFIE
jgi:PDZ domain